MALERVMRACELNEARCEMAVWRLQDSENSARKLGADNAQLRQLVHEDRESKRLPLVLENAAALSREEVRACVDQGAVGGWGGAMTLAPPAKGAGRDGYDWDGAHWDGFD
eukprot:360863-Chlamydomonas_euryale.AAC.3